MIAFLSTCKLTAAPHDSSLYRIICEASATATYTCLVGYRCGSFTEVQGAQLCTNQVHYGHRPHGIDLIMSATERDIMRMKVYASSSTFLQWVSATDGCIDAHHTLVHNTSFCTSTRPKRKLHTVLSSQRFATQRQAEY